MVPSGSAGNTELCTMEAQTTRQSLATMPAHSRVWLYKSAVAFTPAQTAAISEQGQAFADSWFSHGEAVRAAFGVLHDHFVVIVADLADMVICGGSVDGSVQFIKRLEADMGLSLTDRMVVLYEKDGAIRSCHVPDVEGLLKQGEITGDTIVFDDLVPTKGDLDARLRSPLRDTWMARYI